MSGRTLAIFDDEAYALALSDYLNRDKSSEILSLAFTDVSKLTKYVRGQKDSFLLINEKFLSEALLDEISEVELILLCEDRQGDRERAWIYKYQSARLILKELTSYIYEIEDESSGGIKKIHAVCSALNDIERNEYVKVLKRSLEEEGSVLYIDMEPFPVGRNLEEGYGKGLSELIYYLKRGGKDLKWKVKSLILNDGINGRINPSKCSLDVNELTKEDVKTLVGIVKEMTEYDNVLVNVGFYNAAALELFSNCASIDVVSSRKSYEREAAEYFIEQMKALYVKDVERRVQIVEFETGINI